MNRHSKAYQSGLSLGVILLSGYSMCAAQEWQSRLDEKLNPDNWNLPVLEMHRSQQMRDMDDLLNPPKNFLEYYDRQRAREMGDRMRIRTPKPLDLDLPPASSGVQPPLRDLNLKAPSPAQRLKSALARAKNGPPWIAALKLDIVDEILAEGRYDAEEFDKMLKYYHLIATNGRYHRISSKPGFAPLYEEISALAKRKPENIAEPVKIFKTALVGKFRDPEGWIAYLALGRLTAQKVAEMTPDELEALIGRFDHVESEEKFSPIKEREGFSDLHDNLREWMKRKTEAAARAPEQS